MGAALIVVAGSTLISCDASDLTNSQKQSTVAKDNTNLITKRKGSTKVTSVYEFKAKSLDGKDIDLSTYKGDVLLIVNTASECGFTPQYEGLEALQKKFEGRGFKILGFPCNQFGHQEPGDSKTIGEFCHKNYGVTFQMFEKIDVNGKDAHPLYKYLTSAAPGVLGTEAIKWNFTKFLIDKNGAVVKRFAPSVVPAQITPEIETALK
jgi:glutathione peroxidase